MKMTKKKITKKLVKKENILNLTYKNYKNLIENRFNKVDFIDYFKKLYNCSENINNFKKKIAKNVFKKCRYCKSKNLKSVIDLGRQPLANNLLRSIYQRFKKFPLNINFCKNCYNSQLSYVVNKKIYLKTTFISHQHLMI